MSYVWTTASRVFLITVMKFFEVLMLKGLYGTDSLMWAKCEHFLKKKFKHLVTRNIHEIIVSHKKFDVVKKKKVDYQKCYTYF